MILEGTARSRIWFEAYFGEPESRCGRRTALAGGLALGLAGGLVGGLREGPGTEASKARPACSSPRVPGWRYADGCRDSS